jgi:hypothetical protein
MENEVQKLNDMARRTRQDDMRVRGFVACKMYVEAIWNAIVLIFSDFTVLWSGVLAIAALLSLLHWYIAAFLMFEVIRRYCHILAPLTL